jgi:4-amino-4-deoxy-L-arabinose transferase-like glycosyltransferase
MPTVIVSQPGREPHMDPSSAAPPERQAWWIRSGRPAWALPALGAILVVAAGLYTWDLSSNGMGNTFYAAAVKSGTESWKAFLFGSIDPGSFITVDKPPASLWVMELSGRIFGFSSWSMLLP